MAQDAKKTDYILDNEEEMGRLSNQHGVIKNAMGGLLLAPVDLSAGPLRILDSATADGFWIRDLASSVPPSVKHTFVGTDINPQRFPEPPPLGTTYQIQNINEPWPKEWHSSFDIVHQRLALVGAGPAAQTAVAHLTELVKPGGWIQLIEAENVIGKEDGPAMHDFLKLMKDVFTAMGAEVTFAQQIHGWLEKIGFVDVQERLVDVYMGASNASPQLAQQGVNSTSIAATGLVDFAKTLPSGPPSLSKEELETLVPRLKAELSKQGADYPLRVVWGRKPQ
ncbi:hypothetical protein MMC17_003313 [Xylographa soralifera]|nr:hypothetical protein [Xylographa soralifera]